MDSPVRRYHIDLFYSEEDACWIANVPDLTYCSAHGETMEEAAREMNIALDAWLESWIEDHAELPPVKYVSPSARFADPSQ